MGVYILGTTVSIIFAYISIHIVEVKNIDKRSEIFFSYIFAVLSFIPLTFIMAVRYNVGTDFQSYTRIFNFGQEGIEPGFGLLNKILHYFSDSPDIFFAVTSVIICGGYFIAIYRESVDPVYSILLFVIVKDYFISMNGVRQYIAIAIMLFAIPYLKNKQWIKASIVIFIAFLFHKSAIIVLALVALSFIEIPPLLGWIMIGGAFLVSQVLKSFILPFLQRFDFYYSYFSAQSLYGNIDQVFNWQYTLIVLGPFILLCYEYKKVKCNENLKLMYSAVLFSMILMSMSSAFPTLITRLVWYFNAFLVLYIPEAVNVISDKRVRWGINIAVVILYTIVAVRNIQGGAQNVIPYQTIWSR